MPTCAAFLLRYFERGMLQLHLHKISAASSCPFKRFNLIFDPYLFKLNAAPPPTNFDFSFFIFLFLREIRVQLPSVQGPGSNPGQGVEAHLFVLEAAVVDALEAGARRARRRSSRRSFAIHPR